MNTEIKLNGKFYQMDQEVANILMDIVPQAIESDDFSAVWAILDLGLRTGRIIEL